MSTDVPGQGIAHPKSNVKIDIGACSVARLNSLSYADQNGIQRDIYLPPGTVETAWDHAQNNRWAELAKFETFRQKDPSTEAVKPARPQPTNLTYQDQNGVERCIYLPPGTLGTAWDHTQNQRWEELARFETYRGQSHSEQAMKPAEKAVSVGKEKKNDL